MSLFLSRHAVSSSEDLRRILSLPRRTFTDAEGEALAAELTRLLRTPEGTMRLRPIQALALHDIGTVGGLFGPMRVGAGKTLISALAGFILNVARIVLLLPAALVEKTKSEFRELYKHWRIPQTIRIHSYEQISRVSGVDLLKIAGPCLIVADEAHKLKNKRAGVTRRVARYMRENPGTKFVAISGTVMKDSLRDFAHIVRWCLKDNSPIPLEDGEIEEWSDALDEKLQNPLKRLDPGPLLKLASPEDVDRFGPTRAARRGFQRRLVETPGVVATANETLACNLRIKALEYDVSDATEANYEPLRKLWETPTGFALNEAVAVWRISRELALGLHYEWDPRAPEAWLQARKAWSKFVREILKRSRTLDTELQVANACDAGQLPDDELRAWRAVKDTFAPRPKAVWHDESALHACAAWLKGPPGIVWCEHTFFAEELSRRTGRPYFGANAEDRRGRVVRDARPADGSIIASVQSCGTGQNLQAWNRNLVTSPSSSAARWEQLLGRTHREGQESDVTFDVMVGCFEHADGMRRALLGADAARDTLGQSQKLLTCDLVGFEDYADEETIASLADRGIRWQKNES